MQDKFILSNNENNKKLEITIVGAGIVGLLNAINLSANGFKVKIYDKRPEKDLDKLPAVIFLKGRALEKLPKEILNYLYNPKDRKAFLHKPSDNEFFDYDHAIVKISDLCKAAIKLLKDKYNVEVIRGYDLQDVKNINNKNIATFKKNNKNIEVIYQHMLLCCGSEQSLKFDKNSKNIKPKIEIFHTNPNIISKFPMDTSWFKLDKSGKVINTEIVAGGPIKPNSSYTAILILPNKFTFFTTCPYKYDKKLNKNLKRGELYKYLKKQLDVLKEYYPKLINSITGKPELLQIAYARAMLAKNPSLSKFNIIFAGDALSTTLYVYGNELNHTIYKLNDILLNLFRKIQYKPLYKNKIYQNYDKEVVEAIKDSEHHEFMMPSLFNLSKDPKGNVVEAPDWLLEVLTPDELRDLNGFGNPPPSEPKSKDKRMLLKNNQSKLRESKLNDVKKDINRIENLKI